jgi:hypothetical protein
MSGDVYEIRQKTSETCRGWIHHSGRIYFVPDLLDRCDRRSAYTGWGTIEV